LIEKEPNSRDRDTVAGSGFGNLDDFVVVTYRCIFVDIRRN
jgi:hypothetical protein